MQRCNPEGVALLTDFLGDLSRGRDIRAACADVLPRLGSVYATIDPMEHPEVAARQQAVCDACLDALGTASRGEPGGIDRAIALLGVLEHAFLGAA